MAVKVLILSTYFTDVMETNQNNTPPTSNPQRDELSKPAKMGKGMAALEYQLKRAHALIARLEERQRLRQAIKERQN